MPANISPYLLLLLLILLILILILLLAFSPRACMYMCMCVLYVYACIYLYKKIPPPPYMREVVDYSPAPTPSFSLSFFSTLAPLLRFARTVISYLYLSPPTTYTPPSSRRTTGIISVFPQTRLTRNVVQQALRALSTGRDILLLPAAPFCLARSFLGFRLDSTRLRRLIIHD